MALGKAFSVILKAFRVVTIFHYNGHVLAFSTDLTELIH